MNPIRLIPLLLISFSCGRADHEEVRLFVRDDAPAFAVALIGDSISTGVFASTDLGSWPKNLDHYFAKVFSRMVKDHSGSKFAKEFTEVAHSVNDEQEQANRAISTEEAWGLRHTLAIANQLEDKDVDVFLSARFGAQLADAPKLLETLAQDYEKSVSKGFHASHVILMLGANNFCAGFKREGIERDLDAAINGVVKLHPGSRIVVASVPPVTALRDFDYRYRVNIELSQKTKFLNGKEHTIKQKFPINEGVSTDDMRHHYCAPIEAKSAEEDLALLNRIVAEVTAAWAKKPGVDIVLADGIATMQLTKDDIAFDGFHPNRKGQKLIAKVLGEAMLK